MDGVNIQIDSDKINEMITSAVVESAIGGHVNNAIKKCLSDFSFQRAVEDAVSSTIKQIIFSILNNEYKDQIRESVRGKISDKIADDLVGKAFDNWLSTK
jgi:hypothetical protein